MSTATKNKFTRTKTNGKHKKNPGGRPRKYSPETVEQIYHALDDYIENNDIPILAEFAYQNDITREYLYKYEEFSTLVKRLRNKKESQLEKKALRKEVDTGMAVFSLKQLGWSDKKHMELTGKDGGPVELEKKYHFIQEVINNPQAKETIAEQWRQQFAQPK